MSVHIITVLKSNDAFKLWYDHNNKYKVVL